MARFTVTLLSVIGMCIPAGVVNLVPAPNPCGARCERAAVQADAP
ncbi:hypothetical protein AB5J62_19825 [Amycolatopsis sp. cg5]